MWLIVNSYLSIYFENQKPTKAKWLYSELRNLKEGFPTDYELKLDLALIFEKMNWSVIVGDIKSDSNVFTTYYKADLEAVA